MIRTANLAKCIKSTEFQFKKERILIVHHLLTSIDGLDGDQIRTLADAVLNRRDMQTTMQLLKAAAKGNKSGASGSFFGFLTPAKDLMPSVTWGKQSSRGTKEEGLWRAANNFASLVSDSDFLGRLKTATLNECLRDAAVEAEEAAYACLSTVVDSLVAGFGQQILSMQKGDCDRQIQREVNSGADSELGALRTHFVSQIEDLSRQRSRSYVTYDLEESIA
jgi:hypothetical protein